MLNKDNTMKIEKIVEEGTDKDVEKLLIKIELCKSMLNTLNRNSRIYVNEI